MNILKKTKKRNFLIAALVGVLFLTPNTICHAASGNEIQEVSEDTIDIVPIEDVGISQEDAIEMFGFTKEEAKDISFYSTRNAGTIEAGQTFDSTFTFTGTNTGAYRTMNGNKLMYKVIWTPLSGDGGEVLRFWLFPYGGNSISDGYLSLGSPGSGNSRSWQSSWLNIQYGLDYHFYYDSYIGWVENSEARCQVRMIIAVAN